MKIACKGNKKYLFNQKKFKIMEKFIANRIVNGQINTIIGTMDEKNLTYTEKWYFDGKIYKEEKRYFEDSISCKNDYDIACRIFAKEGNLIHE